VQVGIIASSRQSARKRIRLASIVSGCEGPFNAGHGLQFLEGPVAQNTDPTALMDKNTLCRILFDVSPRIQTATRTETVYM